MPDAADLAQQLADEDRAKQRQYVLANTRARWSFVGVGVALLVVIRLVRWVPVSWWFIVAFAAGFVAANYAMFRLARDAAFRPWYAHLNIAVGAALISVVLAALGPTGHALYVAYMIAPLQAARSEEHTSELQSQSNLVCRLLLEKKKHVLLQPPH